MTTPEKHTIYVDVDDEITAIIDKIKNAPGAIVALVLPKRATVLRSVVNMKLLKKSATAAKKTLVLITSESGLIPLAGAVGLYVAATLQTKPSIPSNPSLEEPMVEEITEASEGEIEVDKTKPVGELANINTPDQEDSDVIELDDDVINNIDGTVNETEQVKSPKKGFKVPNFDRFRVGIILTVIGVILLVGGWIAAFVVLPKASVVVATDSITVTSKQSFTANTAIQNLDIANAGVPAVLKEIKKTDTEKITATGKKDNGTKAEGIITVRNCDYSSGFTIPANSIFTASGKSFVSGDAVQVPAFTGLPSLCSLSGPSSGKANIDVIAQGGGESFNIAATQYNVPTAATGAKVDAIGSNMTGGTTKLVTVVAQEDIDTASARMKGRSDAIAKKELIAQLKGSDLKSLEESFVAAQPTVTSTPGVGAETAADVTVTAITNYSILGVKATYLNQLIKKDIETKIDLTKQSILDDGLDLAEIRQTSRKNPAEAQFSLQSIATAGPQLNAETIKKEIKGKKRGDAESIIKSKIGVKDVTITYSPFWVYKTPDSVKKITVTIQKPAVTKVANPNP